MRAGEDRVRLPDATRRAVSSQQEVGVSVRFTCAVLLHIVDRDRLDGDQVLGLGVWRETCFKSFNGLSL